MIDRVIARYKAKRAAQAGQLLAYWRKTLLHKLKPIWSRMADNLVSDAGKAWKVTKIEVIDNDGEAGVFATLSVTGDNHGNPFQQKAHYWLVTGTEYVDRDGEVLLQLGGPYQDSYDFEVKVHLTGDEHKDIAEIQHAAQKVQHFVVEQSEK